MNVKVNGKICTFDGPVTIHGVLEYFKITASKGVAVAVNHSVVPKTEFEKKALEEGDEIEIIRAVQGG